MKKKQLLKRVLTGACFGAMLLSSSALFAQVKIGTNPATIGANTNLEVEATNNKKVIVNKANGTVVIQNVPVGAATDKPMTIDASGNVRQGINRPIPEIIWVGTLATDYTVTKVGAGDFVTLPTRLPLIPSPNSSLGWDATNKWFVVQQAAYYRVVAGATVWGTQPSPQAIVGYFRLSVPNGGTVIPLFEGTSSTGGRVAYSTIYEGYYDVGDKILSAVQFHTTDGQTTLLAKANMTFMSIEKIPF